MSETNSEVDSPEAEENFNIGTAARTRPLSFEEIIERRKNKSEIVDSPKGTSISTDFDNGSEYEPHSRTGTQGFRLASMVVSSKAEEEFESKERDRDCDMVREGARNDGPTLKRSDMRKNNRHEEPRAKRRRSTSRERHERERERESRLRERNRQDPPPERRFDRRLPPERRINRKDLPPTRSPDRKADRRDRHPARSPEKRSDKRNLPSSPERKSDRMDRPSSHSPERKPSKQDHPHSRSPARRPDKWDQSHRRPRSHSPEKKSDRLGHPHSRSQEKKSDKQDRIISRALERRSDKRDQPHCRTPEGRPEKRDQAHSRSPGRRPQQDRPHSRSPGRRSDKRHQPRSRSPPRRLEKRDRPRSRSPQKRPEKRDRPRSHSPEKRNRPRSRSPGRRPEQDRPRSRSPKRRPNKHDRASSRSPERRSDKREQPHSHSPGRGSDKRDQPEKKLEKLVHQDKDNRVDNSSSKQDQENKTEKPQISSVDKKSDKWDKPPAGVSIPDQPGFSSILDVFQTTIQNMLETGTKSIMVEPAQLTQATRPRRRLYIENIPDSASEKTLIDEINTFFPETNPCLTCTINKEKRQALVEFLTPDDATKALSFDRRLLLGTVLRIRRPKDYVEMPNVVPEKPVEEVKVISDTVKDSCHKIFVAGINSQLLSSKELMEIVSLWGPLKAYRFMYSEELGEPCAFLEYEDHSVTLNACAGLNGMRIGTRAITVVQALPNASDEPLDETLPSYDVPLHAKSLLVDATPILQLKNMYDRDLFLQLPKTEVEEDIEDIRLTCARFGTVKSVKIVPYIKSTVPKEPNSTTIIEKGTGIDDTYEILENGPDETENADSSPIASPAGDKQINGVDQGPAAEEESTEQERCWDSDISKKQELDAGYDASNGETAHNGDVPNGAGTENGGDSEDIFVARSVLIEFVRKEAACMAAHELHGELFGGRVMEAGYAPLELFLDRFSKQVNIDEGERAP